MIFFKKSIIKLFLKIFQIEKIEIIKFLLIFFLENKIFLNNFKI
jgi:hypothetical protein